MWSRLEPNDLFLQKSSSSMPPRVPIRSVTVLLMLMRCRALGWRLCCALGREGGRRKGRRRICLDSGRQVVVTWSLPQAENAAPALNNLSGFPADSGRSRAGTHCRVGRIFVEEELVLVQRRRAAGRWAAIAPTHRPYRAALLDFSTAGGLIPQKKRICDFYLHPPSSSLPTIVFRQAGTSSVSDDRPLLFYC